MKLKPLKQKGENMIKNIIVLSRYSTMVVYMEGVYKKNCVCNVKATLS